MKNDVLISIEEKNEYLIAAQAVSGVKDSFTAEEKAALLSAYRKYVENWFGAGDDTAAESLLALDTAKEKGKPATSALAEELGGDALAALALLTDVAAARAWDRDAEKARQAKQLALAGGLPQTLALALARAALDVMAVQEDVTAYREDIEELAEHLKTVEDKDFANAGRFLSGVRARCE